MAFYVGQKVVCVDAARKFPGLYWTPLIQGAVYTVAGCGVSPRDGAATLFLIEQINPHRGTGEDWGYYANRFSPATQDADKLEWARQLVAPKAKDRELVS
jgi:hypothetical protein